MFFFLSSILAINKTIADIRLRPVLSPSESLWVYAYWRRFSLDHYVKMLNAMHCCQGTTEPRLLLTSIDNFMFGRVIFEI